MPKLFSDNHHAVPLKPFLLSLAIFATCLVLISNLQALAQTATPDPPTGLSATPLSPTKIKLIWIKPLNNGSSTVTNYKIEFKIVPNDYAVLVTTTNATTSYTHTNVQTGKNYIYRVSAINSAGTSNPSAEAIAQPTSTSGSGNTAPNPPSSLSATAVSPTQINLSWTAPSNTGGTPIIGYKIERKSGTGSYSILITNTGNATTKASNTGLTTGTTYYYKVYAINAIGTSNSTSESSATPTSTSAPPPTANTISGVPTSLSATAVSTTQVYLTWTAPSNTGGTAITGYKIEVKSGSSSYSVLVANAGTTTSYSHTGLTTGTTYTYRVSAINSVGTGNPSNEVSVKPTTTSTPTGLTAVAGSPTIVYLSWTPPTETYGQKIMGYKIERKVGDAYVPVVDNTGTAGTIYTVTGLKTGSTYTYVVSAVISTGVTGRSNEATVTPTSTSNAPAPTPVPSVPAPTTTTGKKLTKEEALAVMKADIEKKVAEAKEKLSPKKNATEISDKAKKQRDEAKAANDAIKKAKAEEIKKKIDALKAAAKNKTKTK